MHMVISSALCKRNARGYQFRVPFSILLTCADGDEIKRPYEVIKRKGEGCCINNFKNTCL